MANVGRSAQEKQVGRFVLVAIFVILLGVIANLKSPDRKKTAAIMAYQESVEHVQLEMTQKDDTIKKLQQQLEYEQRETVREKAQFTSTINALKEQLEAQKKK